MGFQVELEKIAYSGYVGGRLKWSSSLPPRIGVLTPSETEHVCWCVHLGFLSLVTFGSSKRTESEIEKIREK